MFAADLKEELAFMDISSSAPSDLLSLAQSKLGWLEGRQRVLAENIANSDTPNYQPKDVTPFETTLQSLTVTPVETDPMHLPGLGGQAGVVTVQPTGRSPDGNGVSVEEQMTQVAGVDNEQRLVTNLYSTYMSMFQTAIDKG